MPDLFFYGTLRHLPLLEVVLGRAAPATAGAMLADHSVFWAKDQDFPMILATAGQQAEGLLVRALTKADVARLRFYEGGFDYALRPVTVQSTAGAETAEVFFPDPARWTPGAHWDLAEWVAAHGALQLAAAAEAMAHYGKTDPAIVGTLLPFMKARAWAHQMAQTPAPQTIRTAPAKDAFTIRRERPGYDGFFRMRAFDVDFQRFDGTRSDIVSREGFVAYDAALVLPYDAASDQVLLIEQLRYGPILRNDPVPWTLEPIAGLVDAGEDPADTARREAIEEAGLALGALTPMSRFYASPGYTTEYFHCFLGLCDLADYTSGVGGLASENEDIRSHVVTFDHAMALIDSGEINAGPLILMLLWLARHRDGLRRSA